MRQQDAYSAFFIVTTALKVPCHQVPGVNAEPSEHQDRVSVKTNTCKGIAKNRQNQPNTVTLSPRQ